VTVFSALGQPLRAEVELSATREELASMKAGLASPDAFKSAGLDYASVLLGIRFVVDKRPSGQSIIKLSSDRPLNEPFVDMLLELNWATGRLVREYTFLLDPPEVAVKSAPVMVPEAKAPAMKLAPAPVAEAGVPAAKPASRPKAEVKAEAPAEMKSESADTYKVKQGDNLRKIATANQQEGVSLDQMLVGLLRANKEAFDGGNMNRLKSGKILTVPQKAELEAVSPAEAQKVVVAQAADWNSYRRKLAASAAQAPAGDDAGRQQVSGKITAKVEDKAVAAVETKDQVRVSRTETGKGKPGAKASDDELLAKEKALKDANDRLASLEKNVSELQKLLEMKNQNLAELQKQAAKPVPAEAKKPEPVAKAVEPAKPVEIAKPVEPPKPVEAPKPVEPPKAVEAPKPVEPPKAVEAPKPAEPVEAAKPVEPPKSAEPVVEPPKVDAAKPAEEKKPEEAKPVEAPKPKPKAVIPPPPEEEPGFVDELLDNPAMLAGGGGVLALLAGLFFYKRRRSAPTGEQPLTTSTAGLSQTSLGENSVFRNTGGQSVDTSHTPPQTDFSQAGPGTIDTDEVDPVAEADVYMAYGRDAQAEEILLEAKNKDPKRYAIHLKLLEIYANRQSAKQFETLATELFGETGGVGADWEKAAAMGLKVDAQNPLYGGSRSAVPEFDSDATVIVSAATMKNTVTMPGQLAQMAAAADAVEVSAPELPMDIPLQAEPEASSEQVVSLDFDLGGQEAAPAEEEVKPELVTTVTLPETQLPAADADGALDFDLGTKAASSESTETTVVGLDFEMPEIKVDTSAGSDASALDFDIGFDAPSLADSKPAPAPAPIAAPVQAQPQPDLVLDAGDVDTDSLEFDVRLTESTVLGQPMSPSSFDMTAINLDLDEPKAAAPAPQMAPDAGFDVAQMETVVNPSLATAEPEMAFEAIDANEEVTTKLDLAKAYEEMGDLEGARELLQEVLKEGNAGQQDAARAILERVGS
jgi:pilus assembly protein FimV